MSSLFDGLVDTIVADVQPIVDRLAALPEPERIDALNRIRAMLHEVSPFRDEPVDLVLWVPGEQVRGNDYNPNAVAPPEMKLLRHSIRADHFTQPIVTWQDGHDHEVVDGFHRLRVTREDKTIGRRLRGYVPVAVVNGDRAGARDRVAATIRHNRARGVHGVVPMTDIVAGLIREGWTDGDVARELGMDADEVLRFKQNTGLADLFREHSYGRAWE